jgi:hypothetical protein
VRVENDRPCRAGRPALAEDDGISAGHGDQAGREAPPGHHGRDRLRVALDVLLVARDVGNRQQRDELIDDGALVLLTPGARGGGRGVSLGHQHRRDEARQQDRSGHGHVDLADRRSTC